MATSTSSLLEQYSSTAVLYNWYGSRQTFKLCNEIFIKAPLCKTFVRNRNSLRKTV